jgi:ketosteroid isomerase-like protein
MPKLLKYLLLAAIVIGMPLAEAAPSGERVDIAQLEAELRDTESAFAATMAVRDLEAFAGFLSEEAVFFSGENVLRGKQGVVDGWAPYFDGDALFAWRPEAVAVLESGTLGFSSGPVLSPDSTRVGTFNSVWRRTTEGRWEIVFDRGCPPCGE